MELTVYRQSSKTRPDGTVVYKGEDARPYVDGQIIFVADGLGGAAAIRHQKIVPELFESDKLLDALFKGVYKDYSNEIFVKYVKDSFYELFAVKDCYTDNINNIKKSGYFASRIVTAIILHEVLYSEAYNAEKIFEALTSCENDDAKKAYMSVLSKHFKELIQAKIKEIAKNANLIYESSYSGLALLGSTICATIYVEREDCVEAIYLTAGDSRPYVWTEKNGLCQVLEDQEGKDGGMTNYIKANEDADFEIRCDHFIFDKPCVLFNASDGCFDSGKFISQLAFEKTILDGAVESENTEKLSEYLTAFFLDYGRHDDSSTIAMKMFGYDTYEDFKTACSNRLKALQEEYFDKMSDLLDSDYVYEYGEYERTFPKQLSVLKEDFQAQQGVMDYCKEYVEAGNSALYLDKINEIDRKIQNEGMRKKQAKAAISDAIAPSYAKFKKYIDLDKNGGKKHAIAKIDDINDRCKEMELEYFKKVQKCVAEFSDAAEGIKELLNKINDVGVPESFEDFSKIDFRIAEDSKNTIDDMFELLLGLSSKRLDVIKKLIARRQDYIDKNKAMAERNMDDIANICNLIAEGKINVSDMDIPKEDKLRIANGLKAIAEIDAVIERLNTEDKKKALEEAMLAYWNSEYVDIILAVINDNKYGINADLVEKAKEIISEFKEKTVSIKEKSDMQKALFEKYDSVYCTYIGGATE